MEAKEYAQSLFDKFSMLTNDFLTPEQSKEAAIYCVNEQLATVNRILSNPCFKMDDNCSWYNEEQNYLISVFQEIQKL